MSTARKISLAAGGFLFLNGVALLLVFLLAPRSNPQPEFVPVNLSKHTNGVLHTSWLPNEDPGNNLASLPTGRQEFGGVVFDVQGLIQLQGQCWVKRGYVLPKGVEGIPVHRTGQRVHILHANSGFG